MLIYFPTEMGKLDPVFSKKYVHQNLEKSQRASVYVFTKIPLKPWHIWSLWVSANMAAQKHASKIIILSGSAVLLLMMLPIPLTVALIQFAIAASAVAAEPRQILNYEYEHFIWWSNPRKIALWDPNSKW